jgi:hypothetical protein
MPLTAHRQKLRRYGLHPTIWRKLRLVIGGHCDIVLYGRDSLVIGLGMLERYTSAVHLPEGMDFRAVSWATTIRECQPQPDGLAAFLGPSVIPIGVSHI